MVNGSTSKIIYLGAWLCAFTCIVGIVILGIGQDPIPVELGLALTACISFVAGAHVKAPVGDPVRELVSGNNATKTGRNDEGAGT